MDKYKEEKIKLFREKFEVDDTNPSHAILEQWISEALTEAYSKGRADLIEERLKLLKYGRDFRGGGGS